MLENNVKDSCDFCAEDISAYFDGELDESSAEKLKAHLSSCENCRAIYESLKELSLEIKEAADEPPSDLHQRIMQKINAEASVSQKSGGRVLDLNKKLRRSGMWIGAGVAAVICLAVLGSPIFKNGVNNAEMNGLYAKDMAVDEAYGYSATLDIEAEYADGAEYYSLSDGKSEAENCTVPSSAGTSNGKSAVLDDMEAIEEDAEQSIGGIKCSEFGSLEIPTDTALGFNCDFTPTFMIPRGTLYKTK